MKLPNDEIVHYRSDDGVTIIIERTELVRCKDCKRGGWRVSELDNKTKGYECAIHAVLGFDFGDNGYCSYGERKDNEDK